MRDHEAELARALKGPTIVPFDREGIATVFIWPCVYVLLAADGAALYVGGSAEPRGRLRGHLRSGRFPDATHVEVHTVDRAQCISAVEVRTIAERRPARNVAGVTTAYSSAWKS